MLFAMALAAMTSCSDQFLQDKKIIMVLMKKSMMI